MALKRNVLVVENPISGDIDKTEMTTQVVLEAKKRGFSAFIYQTYGVNDKEKIIAKIKEINPERVIAIGGDGTVLLAASCIYKTKITLGIIPSGSANGMAINFDFPTVLLEQIVVAFSNNLLEVDVVFINDKMSIHISDLGINAELVKNYEKSNLRGKLGYLLQSIPTLRNSDYPYHFRIETKEGVMEKIGILLAIANANKFGTGANINPSGKINDGKFEILVFKNFDFVEIFKTLYSETDLNSDFVDVISTENVTITCRRKIAFQIDGEFIGEIDKVTARIGNEKVLMAVPESYWINNQ